MLHNWLALALGIHKHHYPSSETHWFPSSAFKILRELIKLIYSDKATDFGHTSAAYFLYSSIPLHRRDSPCELALVALNVTQRPNCEFRQINVATNLCCFTCVLCHHLDGINWVAIFGKHSVVFCRESHILDRFE